MPAQITRVKVIVTEVSDDGSSREVTVWDAPTNGRNEFSLNVDRTGINPVYADPDPTRASGFEQTGPDLLRLTAKDFTKSGQGA